MRFDEARQHDHAAAIEGAGAGCGQLGAERDDRAIADMDVARGYVAGHVHGHDVGVADDVVAARWQSFCWRPGLGQAFRCRHPGDSQRAGGGGARQECAAAQAREGHGCAPTWMCAFPCEVALYWRSSTTDVRGNAARVNRNTTRGTASAADEADEIFHLVDDRRRDGGGALATKRLVIANAATIRSGRLVSKNKEGVVSETKRLGDILWVLAIVMAAPALVLFAVADGDLGRSLIVRTLHHPPIVFYVVAIISYTAAIAVVRPDVSLLRCLSAAGWAAALVVVWYTLTLPLHFGTAN